MDTWRAVVAVARGKAGHRFLALFARQFDEAVGSQTPPASETQSQRKRRQYVACAAGPGGRRISLRTDRRNAMKVGIALNMLLRAGTARRRRGARASRAGRSRRAAGLRFAVGARASLHRLRHVAGADPAAGLLRRPHQARAARHRGDRAAVARPDPRRRADRAARHHVRRALPVRLRPRRRLGRVRGLPHPDGRGAAALRRGGRGRSSRRWPTRRSSTRASSSRSRAPRSGRGRSPIPSGASMRARSARNRPR